MTAATDARPDDAPALPTHEQGFKLFQAVLDSLQLAGWERVRVDTFRHPSNADQLRSGMTVRHHYDHGTWELYYERDRYWNRDAKPTHVAKIRLDRPLPEVATVVNELFGPHVGRYYPATAEQVASNGHSKRRPSTEHARPGTFD